QSSGSITRRTRKALERRFKSYSPKPLQSNTVSNRPPKGGFVRSEYGPLGSISLLPSNFR
ncbi:hypothetical protein, partial [uncultured Ruegeria sp.]|uniref:hypothetical protein n=1 Tax=uncultured Ruegeria sp. TaxID=259304 RepID=UPI0026153592